MLAPLHRHEEQEFHGAGSPAGELLPELNGQEVEVEEVGRPTPTERGKLADYEHQLLL